MKGEVIMDDLEKYMEKQMKNHEFRKEYEETRAEFEVSRILIKARVEEGLTQKELAERCGIRQSNISRIENGSCSPTVATLQALASGLGKKLDIRFD